MPGVIRFRARGRRRHNPNEMNKLEAAYMDRLRVMVVTGEILDWRYQAFKLRLADRTYYTPDFVVYLRDGVMEFHEVKGHWEDDARVKIKVAAEQFPMHTFKAFSRKSRAAPWKEEEF